ncbi:MAG: bifunctional (p)ppGpp synthetase/guanosine-3',5'-bis(diphosphate) 3'-pyrophosphohydrolase [Cyanobacteria bacterium P01_G01_bin.38]
MTVTAPAIPVDCSLPNWLETCIIEQSQTPEAVPTSAGCKDNNQLVCRAFEFAYQLHKGQMRASGEPYIAHPVAVAGLLRELGGDSAMIAAGFLHDVVEDTDVTADEIEEHFGPEVRQLVEGVTKLSKFNFRSKTERQAENFRRMFLSMAQDIRVIVVKLADRLHNMRTLQHLAPEKQRRIARETMDIFAPLANRLGIGRFKWELEDLSFKYLESDAYRELQSLISEKRADRENRLKQAADSLQDHLAQTGINCIEVSSRPKHLHSIYRKMERQQKNFHQIYDIAAIRLIVENKDECYRALAIVHDMFRPIPGRFKDYIGLPKANRYQSLHTVVIGSYGKPIEVQIRTMEMHHIAEYGIAAHWKYKETGNSNTQVSADDEKFTWLRQLLEWQSDLKDDQEYLSDVKDNLFDEEVYVFTPKGDVIALGRNATPVDFAYRIHTEVGHRCCGARVNDRIVTLDTPLQNGDIVEIITQKSSHPSLDWLNFVVSAGARNRIRQWYKRSNHDENMARGREMLEKVMGRDGLEALLKSTPAQEAAKRFNYQNVNDLLAGLGYGEITLNSVVNRLQDIVKAQQPVEIKDSDLVEAINATPKSIIKTTRPAPVKGKMTAPIAGVEGLVHHIAGCCNALPGEPIIGVVTLGSRGIAIHQQECPNIEKVDGDRLIPVSWNSPECNTGRPHTYPVQVKIEVIDRVGVLKDILSHLSDLKINVHKASVKTFPGQVAEIDLGLDVKDHTQLNQTFNQIRKMADVLKLWRVTSVEH